VADEHCFRLKVYESTTVCGEIAAIVQNGVLSSHQESQEADAVNDLAKTIPTSIDAVVLSATGRTWKPFYLCDVGPDRW
jgi:hypothetical protein